MSTSRTLRSRIAVAILGGFAVALLSLAFESAMLPGQMLLMQTAGHHGAPAELDPTTVLVDQHDCWVGTPPVDMVGVIPGHVVVTVDGQTRLGGEPMVGKALDQLFAGQAHGLTVHAFCR